MNTIRSVVGLVLYLYLLVLFGRLVLSWVQVFSRDWRPTGPMLVIAEGVSTLTDPPLHALRKVLPPLRIGGVALDLAFFVLILIVYLLLHDLIELLHQGRRSLIFYRPHCAYDTPVTRIQHSRRKMNSLF